ncbi:MAG: ATP-binding cassette domain-containing protein, partial [Clostridium sp.]
MIKVNEINKSFKDNIVLKNASLEVSKGEVISIIGPSGSGKSTFLRCISNL